MSLGTLIVDIYENIIKIGDINILIIIDKNNKIWFGLGHLFKVLDYKNIRAEIKRIEINEQEILTLQNLLQNVDEINKVKYDNDIQPHMKMISESGIFMLLDKSKKPKALELKRKLYVDVLPSIRKNGKYELSKDDKIKIKSLTKKIQYNSTIRKIQQKTHKQYSNLTGKGFIYVLKTKLVDKGANTYCYKIGYTVNLNKRIQTYKTGNPNIELVYQENVNCNKKQLEKCVLNLNILKRLGTKNEIICNSSLDEIKKEINDCKKIIQKYT